MAADLMIPSPYENLTTGEIFVDMDLDKIHLKENIVSGTNINKRRFEQTKFRTKAR